MSNLPNPIELHGCYPVALHEHQNIFEHQTFLLRQGPCTKRCPLSCVLRFQGVGLGEEDVGLIGVTYGTEWIELVPWNAELEWDVDPWGRW